MIYSELSNLDSTADQHLGLTIQFKQDIMTPAQNIGEYLVLIVNNILNDYANRHVGDTQKSRMIDAFTKATDKEKQDAALALNVDLTVVVPAQSK